MDWEKNKLIKKYNIEPYKLKPNHIKYYYDRFPELCCKFVLEPISNTVGPFEFIKAITFLNQYYKDIKSDYYRNLFKYLIKNGEDFTNLRSKYYKDRIILEYLKFRPKTYILTLWPFVKPENIIDLIVFLKNYGYVYHTKKIKLTYNGALNLIYQLYSDTNRFPSIEKLKEKLNYLNWGIDQKNTINIIVFENTSNENISGSQAKLKTKIRDFVLQFFPGAKLRGDDLLHINDNYYQTIEYSKIFFHKKSILFLNKQNLSRYFSQSFNNCRLYINTVKKWIIDNVKLIDQERFLFMGSVVLYLYGIRPCRDIDGVVCGVPIESSSNDFIKKVASFFYQKDMKFFFADLGIMGTDYWKSQWDEKDARWFQMLKILYRDQLIFDPEHHFYFNGLKFVSLKAEAIRKYIRRRYYDFGDLIMIMELTGVKMKLPPFDENLIKSEDDKKNFIKEIVNYLIQKYNFDKQIAENLLLNYVSKNNL